MEDQHDLMFQRLEPKDQRKHPWLPFRCLYMQPLALPLAGARRMGGLLPGAGSFSPDTGRLTT